MCRVDWTKKIPLIILERICLGIYELGIRRGSAIWYDSDLNHKLQGELRGRQRLKLKQRHSVLPAVTGDRRPREATSNGLTLDDDHQQCKPIITPTTLHFGLPPNTRAWSKQAKEASSSLIHSNHSPIATTSGL